MGADISNTLLSWATTADATDSVWSPRYRRLTLGLICTIVAGAFGTLAVATVLPETVDDLGGLGLYGWVFGAFTLANLVGIVIAGSEIDRSGPRRPFQISIVLFVTGLLVGGSAPTMHVLIASRIAQGFATGLFTSVAYAAIRLSYPEELRPRLIVLWSSAWIIPALLGPALAGVIATEIGWRWVFYGIIPMPLIAALLAANQLPRLQTETKKPRDLARLRNATLLAIGVASFFFGIGRDKVLLGIFLTVAGIAIAVPPLRRMTPPGTFRAAQGPAAGVASIVLLNFGFFGVESFIPLALTDLRDQTSAYAGLPLTAAVITWTAGAWALDRRATKGRRIPIVRNGLLLVMVGIGGFATIAHEGTPLVIGLLAWAVAGLGIGLAFSTLQLVVLQSATAGEEGATTSAAQLANTLGITLAAGVGGAVIAGLSTGDEASKRGFLVQSALTCVVHVVGWFAAGRLPEEVVTTTNG